MEMMLTGYGYAADVDVDVDVEESCRIEGSKAGPSQCSCVSLNFHRVFTPGNGNPEWYAFLVPMM